jgi:hypothetical protein
LMKLLQILALERWSAPTAGNAVFVGKLFSHYLSQKIRVEPGIFRRIMPIS